MGYEEPVQDDISPATVAKQRMLQHANQKNGNGKFLGKTSGGDIDDILNAFDDEEFMALALDQLGWDPYKEILEVLSVANQDENLVAKLSAIKYLQDRRDTIRRRAGKLVDASQSSVDNRGRKTIFSGEVLAKTLTGKSKDTPPEKEDQVNNDKIKQTEQTEQNEEDNSEDVSDESKTINRDNSEDRETENNDSPPTSEKQPLQAAIAKSPSEDLDRVGLSTDYDPGEGKRSESKLTGENTNDSTPNSGFEISEIHRTDSKRDKC